MTVALDALRQYEESEAAGYAERALEIAGAVLRASTLAAGKLAIEAVQANAGRGRLAEPAADLRALRTDSRLLMALGGDLARAEATAVALLLESLRRGYETDARGRAKATEDEATGLTIVVDISDQDRRDLVGYPILGHSSIETAKHLVARLRYDLDGALAAPLTGVIDPSAIPASLGEVGRRHGERLATACREAYFAGTQAATEALTEALTGG